jgi:hypothetical protein
MENPTWAPEMESPANQAHRVANFEAAWNDPDFLHLTWRPLSIPPKFEQSTYLVNNDDIDMTQMLRHRNMTHYVCNRTNDSKIYVLIGHMLH